MKPLEIISALPMWAKATPDAILDSPAFSMPCRLGEESVMLRRASIEPSTPEMLPISVAFGDDPHTIYIARSPRFPNLDKLWDSRSDVPEQILLALVERECGALFQLLENAVRKQLRIIKLGDVARGDSETNEVLLSFCIFKPLQEDNSAQPVTFSLTRSATVVQSLGVLRNLDLTHESIRSQALPAEIEYAAFQLPDSDLASLNIGDALMLPEVGTVQPSLIVDERIVLDEAGQRPYAEDSLIRVRAVEASSVALGVAIDGAADSIEKVPPANKPLRLVKNGKTIALGRLDVVGEMSAFVVESLTTNN